MSNEIMATNVNNELTITDKKLNSYIARIAKATNGMMKNQRTVARLLADIDETKCFERDGFESATDFAVNYYGIKKDYARKLVRIGANYIEKDFSTNLTHDENADFTISQLAALLSAKDQNKVRELCDMGVINPRMTFKAITDVVKQMNGKALPETVENDTAEGEEQVTESAMSDSKAQKHKVAIIISADGKVTVKTDGDALDDDTARGVWMYLKPFFDVE